MLGCRLGAYASQSSGSASLLLDDYPATVACSLRKLRTAYSGSAIRVRRSSDDAEQDIGFNGSDLDTSSLLSFVGLSDGFITTWYDQQGSNNFTQVSDALQPKIVSGGVLITENSVVAAEFSGSQELLPASNLSTFSNGVSTFGVISVDGADDIAYSLTSGSNLFSAGTTIGANFIGVRIASSSKSVAYTYGNQVLISSFSASGSTMDEVYVNQTASTSTTGLRGGNGLMAIGSRDGNFYLNGTIQEVIIHESDQASNRTSIESNINNYYSIY